MGFRDNSAGDTAVKSIHNPAPVLYVIAGDIGGNRGRELIKFMELAKEYHKNHFYGKGDVKVPFTHHPYGVAARVFEETVSLHGLDFALYCAELACVHDVKECLIKTRNKEGLVKFERDINHLKPDMWQQIGFLTFNKEHKYLDQIIINILILPDFPENMPVLYVKRADIRHNKEHPPFGRSKWDYECAEEMITEKINSLEEIFLVN